MKQYLDHNNNFFWLYLEAVTLIKTAQRNPELFEVIVPGGGVCVNKHTAENIIKDLNDNV